MDGDDDDDDDDDDDFCIPGVIFLGCDYSLETSH